MKEKKNSFLMTSKVPRTAFYKINDLLSRVLDSLVVQVHRPDNLLLAKIIKKYLEEREINIDKKIDYLLIELKGHINLLLK